MTDFINKIITLILIFVLLILAPLLISYMSTDMVSERLVLNDVNQFIDKVTDKAMITDSDVNDLYLAVNSHGGAYNVVVDRYQLFEEPGLDDDKSKTKLVYIKDDIETKLADKGEVQLNIKDVVKVHVKSVTTSPARRLYFTLIRADKGAFEFSLAGTVR